MAKNLKSFVFSRGSSIYPWDEWLNGKVWELTEGVDFKVGHHSVRMAAYHAAKMRDVKVRTRTEGNKLIIQAYAE